MINNQLILNLRAGDNTASVIKLNPPYNLMVDLEKISFNQSPMSLHDIDHCNICLDSQEFAETQKLYLIEVFAEICHN